jgi:putative transcriptional regulator
MTRLRSRRAMLGLGVLLATPMTLDVALSKPEEAQPGGSLAGQLLVATPEMSDPRFRQTVILMAQHNPDGALGVVINRPLKEVPVAKLLDALGVDSKGINGSVRVFAGGPVEPDVGLIIHTADYKGRGTIDIDGHVAMTANPEVLRDIGRRKGPKQSFMAFGYAGWGPGQLENELTLGGWFTFPEEPKLVFDFDRDKLWDEAMKHHTISL